jgi:hypothetical protein
MPVGLKKPRSLVFLDDMPTLACNFTVCIVHGSRNYSSPSNKPPAILPLWGSYKLWLSCLQMIGQIPNPCHRNQAGNTNRQVQPSPDTPKVWSFWTDSENIVPNRGPTIIQIALFSMKRCTPPRSLHPGRDHRYLVQPDVHAAYHAGV